MDQVYEKSSWKANSFEAFSIPSIYIIIELFRLEKTFKINESASPLLVVLLLQLFPEKKENQNPSIFLLIFLLEWHQHG